MPRNGNSKETNFRGIDTEELVEELCKRMDLKGRDAAKFRDVTMTRAGYKMVPSYVKDRDKDNEDDDDDDYPF